MSKDPAAVALGKKGGTARAAKMSKRERSEAASRAAKERWKDHVKPARQRKKKAARDAGN